MKKITASLLILASGFTFAQNKDEVNNPIMTGAPFLRISPDARAGGLGDQGVATSADNYSQFWNAAKYSFAPDYSGVAFSYTPYMGSLVNDVFLLNATYYTFLGQDERSTLGASIYYFNMGEIQLNRLGAGGIDGSDIINDGVAKPNEFSIDLSYGLRLTDNYSMAVTGRFIRSDLFNGVPDVSVQPANTFAVDIAGYYQSETMDTNNFEGKLRGGFQISNIGPKLDYSNSEDNASYLPTTLRLGVGYDFKFDDYNKVGITTEFSKLLVPTPTYEKDENGNPIPETKYIPNKGVMSGIFSSFGDAPGGGKEELKEIMYSVGAEYSYNDALFIRAGYFHESPMKGDRQHLTLGLGLKYNAFAFNASYLIPMSDTNNALENTLRFGIAWNFGGETQNNYDY